MEQNDISDRTVVVLVILAVVVSILGTWTVLSSVSNVDGPMHVTDMSGADTTGEIRLEIINPNLPTTGRVVSDINSGAQINLQISQ